MAPVSRTPVLFSIGYEGRSLDDLVDLLTRHRIKALVDVRMNAISRRPGFSKGALSRALNGASIQYFHERSLGNPPDNRRAFRAGHVHGHKRYARRLQATDAKTALERIDRLAHRHRTALLCVERDETTCHRSAVAALLASDRHLTVVGL